MKYKIIIENMNINEIDGILLNMDKDNIKYKIDYKLMKSHREDLLKYSHAIITLNTEEEATYVKLKYL